MERTHFAFARFDDSYVGGDAVYGVRVTGGSVEVRAHDGDRESAPLQLETVGLCGSRSYERADDGHLTRDCADGITEDLRNTRNGLEQTWTFEGRPAKDGDLVVEINVAGQEYAGTTEGGVHFRDVAGELGTVYSHATWIDGNGEKTELLARYEHGHIAVRVPGELLATSEYPAVLDPTVGAEYSMDAPIYGPAPDVQRAPVVARSGEVFYDYLVVWQDRRRSLNLTYDIFAAHVDRNGNVREPVGFDITDPNVSADQTQPSIVFHYPYYQIAYTTDEGGGNKAIHVKMIDRLATQPLPGDIDVSGDPSANCTDPAIAHNVIAPNNSYFLYVWVHTVSGNTSIRGAISGPGGLGLPFIIYSVSGVNVAAPAAAGQEQGLNPRYLVTWHANIPSPINNIQGRIIEANGVFVGTSFAITTETQKHAVNPTVATFGSLSTPGNGWIVAWEKNIGTALSPNVNIYAKYVSPSTGALGAQIDVSTATGNQRLPAVTGYGSSNTQAFIAWADFRAVPARVRGARVTVSGTNTLTLFDAPASTGSVNMLGSPEAAQPGVSSDTIGGSFFAVWGDQQSGAYSDIYGAILPWNAPANTTVSNFLISKSSNEQTAPAIAKCNNRYLVAWSDTRNGYANADIYGALLDSSGAVVVSNIQISGATGIQDAPAIACNGTNFFVVWTDERNGNPDIYGNGVDSTTGALLNGPNGIAIATTPEIDTAPAIAFDPVSTAPSYWVVWQWNATIVRGQRLDKNGAFLGSTINLSPSDSSTAAAPDIDFDGTNFVVVWQYTNAQGGPSDIVGILLTPPGGVGTPFTIENDPNVQRYPRVRFDETGGVATVVYEDDRNLASKGVDVYARRVTAAGVVQPAFAVATTTKHEYKPRLTTRTGGSQEVVFATLATNTAFDYDVIGQTVSSGALSGPAYTISATTNRREMTPVIGCQSATSCVCPYRWYDPDSTDTNSDRVKARAVTYP